ncbi:hypothetical protein [Hyalangium rubrum]|uniref:Cytochrome P460 domain-containing protein n=1 Tax=Hyalangium rubrum TaxID=3103134 RepID=A0ABU5H420_9BACT|nr:hypothetical protein [Hyalangium sp. s54d21]MDY7226840.1 hypothetical protein [Hyalangium sp. s54d21]
MKSLRLFLLALATACGGSEEETPSMLGSLDTSEAGIVTFLQERGYRDWLAEPAVHDSGGPHGQVRVFFNDTAVQSLRADNATHPVGAILVKEIYSGDGKELVGHALEAKVKSGHGKDTWLFFEGPLPEDRRNLYGRGHEACHGCHAAGRDYVTTPLPP